MKIRSAEITISAVRLEQYPEEVMPEIVLAGRSNVGKSSLINTLLMRKNLARTSSKPGKTQTLNFYLINESFYFVDIPGYGYAKVSKQERLKWGKMIEQYLTEREQIVTVLLLVDARHAPSQEDIQMYQFLDYYDLPIKVIATKIDKVKKNQRQKHLHQIQQDLGMRDITDIIPFSSVTKEGKEAVWSYLTPLIDAF